MCEKEIEITSEAYQEFERLFLRWLDRHQEGLEIGGLGNPRELATSVAAWAYKNRRGLLQRKTDGTLQPLNFLASTDLLEIESQDHQEESDTERLLRLRSEIDRRSTLLSVIPAYRAP